MVRLIFSSLLFHGRMNLAVALGVAVSTAVLTGALLVGDSVRGSLRQLTLDRLGMVDEVLISNRFFSTALGNEVAAGPEFAASFSQVAPAIMLEGSLTQPDSGARASQVNLFGCGPTFFKLAKGGPDAGPAEGEVFLNQPLADELQVAAADEVVVRLPRPTEIPPDSPLGKKSDLIANRRLKVAKILPAAGLGRFSLRPNQQAPLNAYLHLADLQSALDQPPDRVNALLVAGHEVAQPPSAEAERRLQISLRPKLADYGLSLRRTERGYFNLTSERMLLEPEIERAALRVFEADHPQPAFTYLANYILAADGDRGRIPYSTVTALDLIDLPPLGPFRTPEGQPIGKLADDEIVLNRWAIDDFAQQGVALTPGDTIRLTYFEPESTHGNVAETTRSFKLKAVVAMSGPAADADFTPELRGVTDKASLDNWDPPFPYDPRRVRTTPPHDEDDRYWHDYKATPKAFVSLATGRRLWSSRFGRATSIRIPPADALTEANLAEQMEKELSEHKESLGFVFRPVKRQGLEASRGTTDFNGLFLGFSFFIIASALMLVALLFRLGLERRASEVGTLAAVGFKRRQVRGLLSAEGMLVAVGGGALGLAGGWGYAWLMLAGLRDPRWWLAAVSAPFLQLHITPQSLAIGYASGVVVSWLVIVWSLWRMSKTSIRNLLAGQAVAESQLIVRRPWLSRTIGWLSLIGAVATAAFANRLTGEAQAGAFFGSGAWVLTALLAFIWARLRGGQTGPLIKSGRRGVARLALRNGARNPGRSTLTIGLVGAASFLIIAVSAFRLEPLDAAGNRTGGSGGFALMAQSDQPVYRDLNTADGRDELGFSPPDSQLLDADEIVSLRVKPGDDASCLNLYQPLEPRVLGVPESLVRRGGFAWAATAAATAEEKANPWLLLNKSLGDADGEPRVPVILDAATATYSLHLGGVGSTYSVTDGRGGRLTLEVVGLLKNSIFQGDLLISEQAFLTHYPEISGYRFFLIDAPPQEISQVESTLEHALGDYGFDAQSTRRRLNDLMAVQNTYLSTFQSLGGLGLLLGTFGLAVVQLRNVVERRGELALMRAIGFRRVLLGRMVLLENALLLVAGLAVGVCAAFVAVWPHLVTGGASLPWAWLAATMCLVSITGLVAGLMAVRAALVAPLLPALRGD